MRKFSDALEIFWPGLAVKLAKITDEEMQKPPTVCQTIIRKLTHKFNPVKLRVFDESAQHAGHAGMKGRTPQESHFSVEISSEVFKQLSKLERHRAVYRALEDELKGNVHALKLTCTVPDEPVLSPSKDVPGYKLKEDGPFDPLFK